MKNILSQKKFPLRHVFLFLNLDFICSKFCSPHFNPVSAPGCYSLNTLIFYRGKSNVHFLQCIEYYFNFKRITKEFMKNLI